MKYKSHLQGFKNLEGVRKKTFIMSFKKCLNNIAKDIAINALDEFDKNFDKGGFFGTKWKESKRVRGHNSKYKKKRQTLTQTGALRRSLRKRVSGNKITIFADGIKYAKIHNEGGSINKKVSVPGFKRKGFSRTVKGKRQKVKAHDVKSHSRKMNLKMPKRQFIGNHPKLSKQIEGIINDNLKDFFKNVKP